MARGELAVASEQPGTTVERDDRRSALARVTGQPKHHASITVGAPCVRSASRELNVTCCAPRISCGGAAVRSCCGCVAIGADRQQPSAHAIPMTIEGRMVESRYRPASNAVVKTYSADRTRDVGLTPRKIRSHFVSMTPEDDFDRSQRRMKIRNTLLLIGLVGSLLLAFPVMIGFTGASGLGGRYVLAPLPLLVCYGIVRVFFTKGR